MTYRTRPVKASTSFEVDHNVTAVGGGGGGFRATQKTLDTPLVNTTIVYYRLAKSTRFPGRLPVFQHFYPSTRFLIFLPVFGIPISKQNCIFTDKYRRNS